VARQVELAKVSNLALALIGGIAVNWQAIVSLFGSWVLVASALTAIVSVGLGALIGHADSATRTTTGLVSGLRFGSLGLIIIGTQLNANPDYLGPAIVFSLVDLILVLFLSVEIGRRPTPTPADDPDPREGPVRSRLAPDEHGSVPPR
jgi:hypothetical protein